MAAQLATAVAPAWRRYRWAIAALWFLAFFEIAFHRFALAPLVPALTAEFKLSYAALGALTSGYFLAYAALQLPAGMLVDHFGARRVMLASLATLSVGVLLFPFIPNFEAALGLRMLIGLGAAAVWICGVKLMYVWFPPREYSRVTGVAGGSGPASDLAALWLLPPVAAAIGWRFGYFLAALSAPVVLLLCWRFLRAPATPPIALAAPSPPATPRGNLRLVFANGRLWALGLTLLLYFGGYVGVLSWLPTYYGRELGYPKVEASFLAGFAPLALPLAMPLVGFCADRLGRREAVYAALVIANAALLAVLPLVGPRAGERELIVLTLLISVSYAGIILPYSLLPSLVPASAAGTASGLINTLTYSTNFLYPIALGWVADATGTLAPILLVVAAGSGAAGLIALRLAGRTKQG